MTGRTSGLERDLNLVRRRAWLFIPFLLFGVLVAVVFGSLAGQANAVATLQIETVIHQVFTGGDRGFRIFEADQMTREQPFREKVIAAIGDPNFDYGRFSIALATISVGDGVASGTLTVAVKDADKAASERYRQAFVDTFIREYTAPDGLFRERFLDQRRAVAVEAEAKYQAAYKELKALAATKNLSTLPLDQIALHRRDGGLVEELNGTEAALQSQLAEVQGAQKAIGGASPEVANTLAGLVLKTAVSGNAVALLAAREQSLQGAIAAIRQQRAVISDGAFDPEFLALLDQVRGADQHKEEAWGRVVDAQAAVASAQSTVTSSYSATGGVAASLPGRGAVALAVTIVFGLIAIYGLEWLSQIRNNAQD